MDFNSVLSIANAVFNVPLCIITIVGNTLVLVSIARTPSLISPSNILLVGLAFTDLCVGLIVQPLYITLKFAQYTNTGLNLGILTIVHAFFGSLLCAVSLSNVTLLSIDRFLALHLHLRYKELGTVKRTVRLLGIIWLGIAALVPMIGLGLNKSDSNAVLSAVASITIIANAMLYYGIYRIVRRHQIQIHSQLQVQSTGSANFSRLKKSFINTFFVYLLFAICYLPHVVMCAFRSRIPLTTFEISWTFVYVNSFINPVLFAWRVHGVQEAISSTVQKAKQLLLCR